MPLGPRALSLQSRIVNFVPALIIPLPIDSNACGISVFKRPVNKSFHSARFNSGWFSRAQAIAFAEPTPSVLPSRLRNSNTLHAFMASATSFPVDKYLSIKSNYN